MISGGTVVSPSSVIFKAGNSIELKSDFEVEQGASFDALIETCNGVQMRSTIGIEEKDDVIIKDN